MNFLAHGWLANGLSDDFLYGNLIADGVKGARLTGWDSDVAAGIRHHRRVDAYVDQHPVVRAAQARAPSEQRRFAGIALDILWDHFLVQRLDPLQRDALVERCYRLLEQRGAPARLSAMVPVLVRQDWLRAYADFGFTCRAIAGVGQRLSGPNRLAALIPWLHDDYPNLAEDFSQLWRSLVNDLGMAPQGDAMGLTGR